MQINLLNQPQRTGLSRELWVGDLRGWLYNGTVRKPSIFTLEVFMENGTVHNPSIFSSEVVMETDNPPNH